MLIDAVWVDPMNLAIGKVPDQETLIELEKRQFKVILSLCEEKTNQLFIQDHFVDSLHIPLQDMSIPTVYDVRTFIRHMNFYNRCSLPVFMHCYAGYGRSGTLAAIYWISKGFNAKEAINKVRQCRPGAIETSDQEQFIYDSENWIPMLTNTEDTSLFNAKKIVEVLRRKCPWDREQTHESLIDSLLDESYEVVEAIREKNIDHLKEEIGDLLLQPFIQAQVAEDENQFTIFDSIDILIQKLINRHPHVFDTNMSLTPDGVINQWSKIKKTEQTKVFSPIDDIMQISREAAEYGFDWENPYDILRKVEEEVKEVENAIQSSHSRKIEQEIGDLLFAVLNVARFLKIDPIKTLEKGRRKFEQRFRYLQTLIQKEGKEPKKMSSVELDDYWNRVKEVLNSSS